jgi:hypothetical protein
MRRCHAAALCLALSPTALADDWLIGLLDPEESIILAQDRVVDGNLYILNQASLHVTGGTLTVTGMIGVFNQASLEVEGAKVHFAQEYAYQSGFGILDQATLDLTDTVVDGNGRSYSIGLSTAARGRFERVQVQNGFCTWVFSENASQELIDCQNAGEFLLLDVSTLDISGSTNVLFWVVLPDGSAIDTTFPPPGHVDEWSVGPETPWADGIPYRASLSDCDDVMWAVMARSGSEATVRDSTLRVVGSIFERDDTVEIKGLANKAWISDAALDWGSIQHRLLNTYVETWNFYPWGTTKLTLDGCIFGEINSDQASEVTVLSSMCDATGGYIGAFGQSQIVLAWSTNLSQTTTRDQAVLIAVGSALLWSAIDSTDNSTMLLLNTEYAGEPEAHDASAIFDAAIDPVEGVAGDALPLRGSARLLRGPTSPIAFDGYTLDYGAGYEPQTWLPVGGPFDQTVRDGELGVWQTGGLEPGPYAVRVSILTSPGDPVSISSGAALAPNPCPSDLNGDGVLDLFDFLAFVNLFGAGDPAADCDGSGGLDLFDFLCFANAFNAGC